METTLHRQLKQLYAGIQQQTEVTVGTFRCDATIGKLLVEIQSSPLQAIRAKLRRLLNSGQTVLLVKPFAVCRHVEYEPSGRRRTFSHPPLDVFRDLVSLHSVFPHPGLIVDVIFVTQHERRTRSRTRRRTELCDRRLAAIHRIVRLRRGPDLWQLLPHRPAGTFTSKSLAEALRIQVWEAQLIAYCLHRCGAARRIGARQRYRLYEPVLAAVEQVVS